MPALQASTTSRKKSSTPVVVPVMPRYIASSAAAGSDESWWGSHMVANSRSPLTSRYPSERAYSSSISSPVKAE